MPDEIVPPSAPMTAPVPAPKPATVPLHEWAQAITVSDKRVELVNAFFAVEHAAGRDHDTEANYAARLLAFANAPA